MKQMKTKLTLHIDDYRSSSSLKPFYSSTVSATGNVSLTIDRLCDIERWVYSNSFTHSLTSIAPLRASDDTLPRPDSLDIATLSGATLLHDYDLRPSPGNKSHS